MNIYHYTDLNGLKGIIESGALWATNYAFLNDSQELTHGLNCLRTALKGLGGEFKAETIKAVESAFKSYQSVVAPHIYNISFCAEPDLLSQWRGYGSTQGVCLEFDSNELQDTLKLKRTGTYCKPVVYTREDVGAEASLVLKEWLSQPGVQDTILANPEKGRTFLLKLAFAQVPFFKNEGFSEEKEFRVAITEPKKEEVKFRVSGAGLIPYLEVRSDGKLPLKSVRIGPCKDREQLASGIRYLLVCRGYGDVEITHTETPFR